MLSFKKPALDAGELLKLLQQRGLTIPDQKRAAHYLQTIGYYRLSAYFIPFKICSNKFCPQANFDDILELYIFDRKLRLLVLDPLERIEIAVRTAISDQMSVKYGAFWFLNKNLFENQKSYLDFITYSKRLAGKDAAHKSVACAHYFEKYGDNELPPSWVLIEELPMGTWSRLYANLKNNQDKRAIAEIFDFKWRDLKSWLEPMTILRNLCAHHRRFWNISLPIKPRNLERYAGTNAGNIDGAYLNAEKGERCHARRPGHWTTYTMLSYLKYDGKTDGLIFSGGTDKATFRNFMEAALLPEVKAGDVVIMDNLRVHKNSFDKTLFERKGVGIKYLPRYSPEEKQVLPNWM